MSITCKFELPRCSSIYNSGEEIAGSLTISSLKMQKIEDLILEFYGRSTVQWHWLDKTKEKTIHNDFSVQEVSNKTTYHRQQQHVCEQLKLGSSNDLQLHPHVEYTFKFCFSIPQQAPATFCCRYGQTEYGLKLQVQRLKKNNKEFHKIIVVKNKLDLTQDSIYKMPYDVHQCNKFGHISLKIPCTGFTPGQKIPYFCSCQTTQRDFKLLIQFNCYTTCNVQGRCSNFKQIKEIVNYSKHLPTEILSCINIPLHIRTSSVDNDLDHLIFSTQYKLEAFVIDSSKKVMFCAQIPLTIGTIPCCTFKCDLESEMCYDNFASRSTDLWSHFADVKILSISNFNTDQDFESFSNLPFKRKTNLRNSLRNYYRKLIN